MWQTINRNNIKKKLNIDVALEVSKETKVDWEEIIQIS